MAAQRARSTAWSNETGRNISNAGATLWRETGRVAASTTPHAGPREARLGGGKVKAELVKAELPNAKQRIARISTIEEVKDFDQELQVLEKFAKLRREPLPTRNRVTEARVLTMRRGGELVKELPRTQPNVKQGVVGIRAHVRASKLSPKEAWRWELLTLLTAAEISNVVELATPPDETGDHGRPVSVREFIRMADEKRLQREAERIRRDNKRPEQAPTLVIDPPWDWGDEGDDDQKGRARPDYQSMSFAEVKELPVVKHVLPNSHLYLWITNRSLPKGFELIEHWGFRYVTCLTWCKPSFGMGNYFRGQTEHVLFGVRGSLPLKRRDIGTTFHGKRGKLGHSAKPTEFYELVEVASPGPWFDWFGRTERKGWFLLP